MSGSPLKRLAVHASHYTLGSLLTMVAGLVTFPLLTRIFSVADYGVMNLIGVSVTVSVAVGKVGQQAAVLRFHSEIAAGKRPFTPEQLSSTSVLGMLATGVSVAALVFAATRLVPDGLVEDPRVRTLMAIMCVAIVMQVVASGLVNLARAQMRTKLLVAFEVGKKYLGLALILFALLAVSRSLTAFYVATATTEVLAVLALGLALYARRAVSAPRPGHFSPKLFKEMLSYGLPMMVGKELAGIVLSVGDRYVIGALAGAEPLGLYSAAYNMCEYVYHVLIASVGLAVMPIYMQMWEQQGRAATSAFIDRSLRSYALLGAPVVAGVTAVGPELLPALASSKYASATVVVPWVIAGMVVAEANSMLGAGLYIARRTRTIMVIIMSCAALNVAMNVVLIPRIGIVGSAIATLASYASAAVLLALAGRAFLPVTLPWATIARAAAASLVMYLVVAGVYPGHGLLSVGVRAALGAPLYAALVAAIDPDARALLRDLWRRRR